MFGQNPVHSQSFGCPILSIKIFLSLAINLLLTSLSRDRTWRISALGLLCTDLAALGPYCQDLGPIFSQYGPRAWLRRCIQYIGRAGKQATHWESTAKKVKLDLLKELCHGNSFKKFSLNFSSL